MDKIKKYIEHFILTIKINDKYDLTTPDLVTMAKHAISKDAFDAVNTAFGYGYIKGYRACKAERKEGGAV